MPGNESEPRKRRTREHIIASLSVNHVERFIIDEGHTVEQKISDYGHDLAVFTHDASGYVEEGTINIQLKAAESLILSGNEFVFDIDVRDYSLWIAEPMPVILIRYDASKRHAYWLYVQRYFAENSTRKLRLGAKTIRVRIPKSQVVSRAAIRKMRSYKQAILEQIKGAIRHAK